MSLERKGKFEDGPRLVAKYPHQGRRVPHRALDDALELSARELSARNSGKRQSSPALDFKRCEYVIGHAKSGPSQEELVVPRRKFRCRLGAN